MIPLNVQDVVSILSEKYAVVHDTRLRAGALPSGVLKAGQYKEPLSIFCAMT